MVAEDREKQNHRISHVWKRMRRQGQPSKPKLHRCQGGPQSCHCGSAQLGRRIRNRMRGQPPAGGKKVLLPRQFATAIPLSVSLTLTRGALLTARGGFIWFRMDAPELMVEGDNNRSSVYLSSAISSKHFQAVWSHNWRQRFEQLTVRREPS